MGKRARDLDGDEKIECVDGWYDGSPESPS